MGAYLGVLPWPKAEGKRILLAEDNEINAAITMSQLKEFGVEVDWELNGKNAVERFEQSNEGYYAAIVMDVMMPVMNGNEATEAIRKLSRSDCDVPIIAITANAFMEDVLASQESGMDWCITKPYDKRELFDVLIKFINCDEI